MTFPPASLTSNIPAARSQGLAPATKYASKRPEATYAKSKAAEPVLLTD